MNKIEIMNNVTRSIHRFGFKAKKHSPELLIAAGVVGVVASGIMACKATTKLSEVLEDHKDQTDQINGYIADHGSTDEYNEEDQKKDLAIVYTQTGLKLAKMYAPAIALGALSLTAIVASNRILNKRNAALAAAYTIVDKGFKEYRGRVVERFGTDLDRELRYNLKAKEIQKTVVNDDGTETTVTEIEEVAELDTVSDYARFFDEGCSGWSKDPEYNLMYLRRQQDFANEKLKANGFLFLNEVYQMLDIPRTTAGQSVGWIYDEKHPNGDNYVDFGIYNTHREASRSFVNGWEKVILLDFNVDGNIVNMI